MIKKLPLLLLLSIVLLGKAEAQLINNPKIKLGLQAGINFSSFTKDVGPFDKTGTYYETAGHAGHNKYVRMAGFGGIVSTYQVSNTFSLGAELLYNQRGAAYRKEDDSKIYITTQRVEKAYNVKKYLINLVELPLTARFTLRGTTNTTEGIILYGGLAPGIRLKNNPNRARGHE